MRHFGFISSILLALCLVTAGCGSRKDCTVRIVHTTDVHGRLVPYDFITGKDPGGTSARLASFLKEARTETPNLLLLDGGDLVQGTPLVYFDNRRYATGPHLTVDVYNRLGYNAMCIGNHDIEAGHDVYDRFAELVRFPILCCNITRTDTGESYYKPYETFVYDGVKIAVIGLVTPAVPEWLAEPLYAGMRFEEPIDAVRKTLQTVREKEQPDLVVLLTHSGLENKNPDILENASRAIAEKVSGINIILMGHDHEPNLLWLTNPQGDSVLLINPADRLQRVSDVKVTFRKQGKKVLGHSIDARLTEMEGYTPDDSFMQAFQGEITRFHKEMERPVGRIDAPLKGMDALFGSSAYISLIHKVQLAATGADISFAAPTALSLDLPEGELTYADMFALYPFENTLYAMELTGAEVKGYLEYSYNLWVNRMTSPDDHLLALKPNLREGERFPTLNPTFNFSSAGGIHYTVDVTKPNGERVTILSMADGTPFDLNHTYTVAINSYRGNGGGGHLVRGAGIPKAQLPGRVKATSGDVRSAILQLLAQQPVTSVKDDGNWCFVPEDWANEAARRDRKIVER